jgi:hypothetical protein
VQKANGKQIHLTDLTRQLLGAPTAMGAGVRAKQEGISKPALVRLESIV